MDVYAERLYAALTDALRRSRQHPFKAPVTVAEIYQDLVPYRVVRSAIGFELNADYEHALLQLLAGVSGLARLELESAAAELREELSAPNPNVGLFRKFAACDVWIAPAEDESEDEDRRVAPERLELEDEPFAPEEVEEEPSAPERVEDAREEYSRPEPMVAEAPPLAEPGSVMRASASGSGVELPGAGPAPASHATSGPGRGDERLQDSPHHEAGASPSRGASDLSGVRDTTRRCGFCDTKLPAGRLVRFCPHCGRDQKRQPCVACGEALEQGWRYCVTCGAPQGGSDRA